MKAKRSLITVVAVFFVALACAFGVLNLKSKASASEFVSAPSADAIVSDGIEGFELAEKASIRLTDNKVAIKFSATVTEDFHNSHEGVVYVATMNVVGSSNVKALEFDEPYFENGVATLNAYLNFGNATEEVLAQALDVQFESAIYAKVGDVYYQAQNSNDVERSMRAVANDAYLNWEEGLGYERADVLDLGYFTNGLRSDKTYAAVDDSNTLYVHIPSAPAGTGAIYVDDVKVEATYDEATEKYTVTNLETEGSYVTIFDADGKAYSTDFVTGATAIANLDEFKATLGVAAELNGYYVLTSDIEVGSWAAVSNIFNGTLNGLGYALSDVKTSAMYSGLFSSALGGAIKNLNVAVGSMNRYSGALFGYVNGDSTVVTTVTMDNVSMYVPAAGDHTGLIVGVMRRNNVVEMNDCLFITAKASGSNVTGMLAGIADGANPTYPDQSPATFVATNVVYTQGGNATLGKISSGHVTVAGATPYLDSATLVKAMLDKTVSLPESSVDLFATLETSNKLVVLTNDNIQKLQTATSGEWILAEDIDMWDYTKTTTSTKWNSQSTFTGLFDGNGYSLLNFAGVTEGTSTGDVYNGIFFQLKGATIKNLGIEFLMTGSGYNRGCLASQIIGEASAVSTIENIAVRADVIAGIRGSVIASVVQSPYVIKNSLIATGQNLAYAILGSGEATSYRPVVDNLVVLNHAGAPLTATTASGVTDYYAENTSNEKATNGVEYFDYATGTELMAAMAQEKFTLPESVMKLADELNIIVALNKTNISRLMNADGCGYWYLTDDIDVKQAGINSWTYAQSGHNDAYYHNYVNIEIDGCGHKLTNLVIGGANNGLLSQGAGGTIKNMYIHYPSSGSTYTGYLFGISRNLAASGNDYKEVYNFENLVLVYDAFYTRYGGAFVAFGDGQIDANINNVFMNIKNELGVDDYNKLAFGYNMGSTSVAKFANTFIVGKNVKNIPFSMAGVTIQDASGNAITPGGTGVNDGAIIMVSTIDDLKALNSGADWAKVQTTFGALAPEFFEIQA